MNDESWTIMVILEGCVLLLLLLFWIMDIRKSAVRNSKLYNFSYV